MKMRVPVPFIDCRIEAPDAVGTGDAVGELVRHQPVERSVECYPIVLDTAVVECDAYLVVGKWPTGTAEDVEDGNPRACGAAAACGNAQGTGGRGGFER